jgi:penicillin-binding protein 1A
MSRHQRQRRSRRASHPFKRVLSLGAVAVLLAIVGGGIAAAGWVISTADSAPNLSSLAPRVEGQLSEVFASDGTLLGYLSSDVLRRALTANQEPALLRDATVAIEDRRFFHHGAVDYQGILRAAVADLFGSGAGVQGASTLTMQLVKNVYLPLSLVDARSFKYKIVEIKLADELYARHSKRWILTQYLNDVPYGTVGGQSAYGVAAASQMFFDKPVTRLDLAQIALLAGLPQAPTSYNPFLNPTFARERRSEVLAAMVRSRYITPAQAAAANASPLQVRANHAYDTVRQPYVFDYVRQQLINRLGVKTVDAGGLKVYTSINLQDQQYAQQALAANEGQPGDPDAVVVSVDPSNGDIVAMAQNTSYGLSAPDTTLNSATQALRQTGSAFKAFSLMALIHDYDGNPNSTYYVSKKLHAGWLPADPTWSVATAERTYAGTINVTQATTVSDNTVYAQLGVDLGLSKVLSMAYAMGITTPQKPYYPAIIGGLNPGVTPLQMADAYATIANGGEHYPATIITGVRLPSGRFENLQDTSPTRVFSAAEAYAGTQALETVLTPSGTGYGAYYGCPAAGKTGTTNNYTDAWFVGYTPQLSTSVWVGYTDEGQFMENVNGLGPGYGGTLAAPIWRDFMEKATAGNCSAFPVPAQPFVGKPFKGAHSVSAAAITTPFTVTTPSTTTTSSGTGTTTGTGTGTTSQATTLTTTAPAQTAPPTTPTAPAPGAGAGAGAGPGAGGTPPGTTATNPTTGGSGIG